MYQEKKVAISVPTILYFTALFLIIVSRYMGRISFSSAAVLVALELYKHINVIILSTIFVHLCLLFGETIGHELLGNNKKRGLIKSCMVLLATAVLIWFLIEKLPNLILEPFYMVMGIYLVAFSGGKGFDKVIKTFWIAYIGILLTAVLGVIFGYTTDVVKITDYGAKHAFGMAHPNIFAHVIFVIVIGAWYLYLKGKKFETFLLFWNVAILLIIWNRCRTIIIMLLLMPIVLQLTKKNSLLENSLVMRIITVFPLICLGISLLLSIPVDLIHRFTYDNMLFSIGERFVQVGIALREYGLPILGHSIDTTGTIKMMVDGETIRLFVLDNAFISYGIILGLSWLVPCICLLCLANRMAWKEKEYGLVVYGLLMCVFAVLERRGLDPTFNLLFFYPLSVRRGKGILNATESRISSYHLRIRR